MHGRIVATATALLLLGAGASFAQSNAPAIDNAPTRTTVPAGPGSPTITPDSAAEHDPRVNPNAAGMQRGWRGYGATEQTRPADQPTGSSSSGR